MRKEEKKRYIDREREGVKKRRREVRRDGKSVEKRRKESREKSAI